MFRLFFALGAVAIAKRLERAVPYDDGRVRLRSFDEDELQRLQAATGGFIGGPLGGSAGGNEFLVGLRIATGRKAKRRGLEERQLNLRGMEGSGSISPKNASDWRRQDGRKVLGAVVSPRFFD